MATKNFTKITVDNGSRRIFLEKGAFEKKSPSYPATRAIKNYYKMISILRLNGSWPNQVSISKILNLKYSNI